MITSLRTRLLVGTIGSIMLLLAVFSLTIYSTIRKALLTQFDTALESTARLLTSGVEWEQGRFELDFAEQQTPEFGDFHSVTFYEIWDANGTVIGKSSQLQSDHLPRLADDRGVAVFATRRSPEGTPERVVGMRFRPHVMDEGGGPAPEGALTLTVARSTSVLYGQLTFLRRLLWIASAALAVLSIIVSTIVVRHGLSPLNVMATQIASIEADD